ncbi:MAG: glycoside hydrolase family 3 N-terminal domain-containing protein [Eubacteriales bacterium]|nr:glycoside hydrolase family 3 N-terminal domain-containing protein [Eubacteriales bacterium]
MRFEERMLPHEVKHIKVLRENAAECAVLLKKDGKFPLEKPGKLALYGNGARRTVKGGTGSGNVYSRCYSTCEEGLEYAGFEVTTKNWLDAYDSERDRYHGEFVEEIKRKAAELNVSPFVVGFGKIEPEYDYEFPLSAEGEACVYVLGRISGEGNDREIMPGDVLLTDTEVRDILALNGQFERFMLVLNVGGVIDLTPVKEVKNILYLSQLGAVTGDILADILLGKANPSGKLTTTWAAVEDYQKIGEFGSRDDTRYKEGIYVGYRYFDTAKANPLFPFGFGLSYSEFEWKIGKISVEKGKVNISVSVSNIANIAGKEVIQLYVSAPKGKIPKPYQGLAAFAKTKELQPGESQTILLAFDLRDTASYCEACEAWVLEQGDYIIRVGTSSRNTQIAASLKLDRTVETWKLKKRMGEPDFEDAVIEFSYDDNVAEIPKLEITAADFETKTCDYMVDRNVDEFVAELSNEEAAYLCLGAFLPNATGGIVGNSAFHVAGAAGETTNYLTEKLGDRYLVMADGPAGIRISRKYALTEKGVTPVIEKLPDGLDELLGDEMNAAVRKIYESIPPETIQEQYTTAIPIGTAIAQSWNTEFAKLCGDIVGTEMEIYGIHLWLAPALNIHRDIRCGRNFEYFSEDPFISGKMAAGITLGVQSHEHRGTTIKHFAANNQENNRYNSNSIVSRRAMREIYLKGFEIAIRESQPKAVMTSYNLLNGEHTSQCKDLVEEILRGEFGFQGLVMTDWVTTGVKFNPSSAHPAVYAHKIIKAGNDIVMAGGQPDFDDMMEALNNGTISRQEIDICATRVLRAINNI